MLTLFISATHAEDVSMDEKRLQNFNAYLLKKEAQEAARMEQASKEKIRRQKIEDAYEKARAEFLRPEQKAPMGLDEYNRKMALLEERYDQIRKAFAEKQQAHAKEFFDKIDRTKMVEYDL